MEVTAQQKKVVRVRTAANICEMSPSSMYAMIARGEMPVVRFGKSMRVPVAAIDDYIARNQTVAS